ncbi:uncharacterized protein LOC141629882 [Silene latifolia]|uniref:uncharacterized protein LOC141629882 n=1 Tax=Silene latifolia TaxID=37657 RepID=UPI003D7819FD
MGASTSSLFPLSTTVNEEPESLIEAEVTNAARRHTKADKHISCREYSAYKLEIQPGNLLLRGGRLFQQFIVDMYVKIENTRLDFIRLNQDTIRADLYQGILDTLELGENSTSNVGRRVILPPSFLGGPRDMRRRYLNAMALVQKYGKPDIFLTMTCNPNWIEIKTELAPGEQAHNRPDLVARIFHAKLTALRKEIMERKKCGLPHAHFLIILRGDDKIRNPESFDRYVFADIPSRENPPLRGAVLRHMMHGPCGNEFPKSQCMQLKKGKRVCKSEYPKKFSDFTTNGSDCYPLYGRRDTGKIILVVKYLYKYVYKGHDRISFNVEDGETTQYVDEIERYQSGRWVSPSEAAWRIFGFNLFDIYPPVHSLPANSKQKEGPRYLYSEFPEHFLWNGKRKEWKARDRGVAIGRVAHAAPGEGERYYLKLLLAHVRGPTSFEDLLTFEGIIYTSFQEASLKRGILEQDNVADHCMDEVVQIEQFLEGMGRTFADFYLQHLQIAEETGLHSTRDIEDTLNAPVPHEQLASKKKLNVGQKNAYKTIMYHVKNSIPGAFFIDGPGGTGKTFLYGALYAKVRAMGKICLPTATSGITTSNLPTDRTTHSRFKLPLDTDESLVFAISKQVESSNVNLPAQLILKPNGTACPVELLVDSVFPEVKHISFSPDIFNDRAILTPRNNDVDLINKLLIEKFPGREYIYKSFDRVINDSCNVYPSEFLNTLCPPGMTPHELVMKENSPVVLLRNLDPAAGLCNGTRLERVGVYLPKPCFSHGQLYVALSRARSAQQLKVLQDIHIGDDADTSSVKNIVSFEMLRRAGIRSW